MTAATWQEPAMSSAGLLLSCHFLCKMGSPASHIVAFGILAPSTQLHCFQLDYDGVAKMGICCRVLVGDDVPMPASLAPLPMSSGIPAELGTARQGRSDLCKANAGALQRCRPGSGIVLDLHRAQSLGKVSSGCEHAEGFLCRAAMSHQRDAAGGRPPISGITNNTLVKECRRNRDRPIFKPA